MLSLRLGSHALLPTDVELVRMLLRLYGLQGKFKWTYAELPPYDAILVDQSLVNAGIPPDTESTPPHVLRLTGTNDTDAEDTLPRPVCPQKLGHWLDRVGQALAFPPAHTPSDTPEAAAPELVPEPASEETAIAPVPLATEPPPLPPDNAPRFSLRRWPRKGILRDDPSRIRMATLLSRRALNARDLVSLTGFAPHQCQVFLQTLHASSLLQPAAPTIAAQAAESTIDLPQPTRPAKPQFTHGLISGLRKRLGL